MLTFSVPPTSQWGPLSDPGHLNAGGALGPQVAALSQQRQDGVGTGGSAGSGSSGTACGRDLRRGWLLTVFLEVTWRGSHGRPP